MIRRAALLFVVTLAGCDGLRDAFTGHQDVVAKVGDHELTAEMLANTLANAKQVPLRREVMSRITDIWIDYQLVGQAVASGDSLLDSATVEAANWPLVAQRLAGRLRDSLIVGRSRLTDAQIDSAYNAGNEVYLFHLLVAARQDSSASEALQVAKRRQAEGYLAQIRRGTSLQSLASRFSDDPGSKAAGGRLGIVYRGMTVQPFEEAAFGLQPGQTSDIVVTPFGYHIIYRPALAEVRDSFAVAAQEVLAARLDSLYLDSLSNQTGIRVRGSAPARVRAAAENLQAAKEGSRVLATYRGGRLRERDFAHWLQAYPPQVRGQVAQAPDSVLSEFVKSLARNDMVLNSARRMGIRLTAEEWDSIRTGYRRELDFITAALAVAPESLATDTAAQGNRAAAAARRIDAYFQSITTPGNTRPYVEVPAFLADALRSRMRWSVSEAGIDRALERARVVRGPETPAGRGPMMQPAPGGPPVGGDSAPAAPAPRPRG